MKTFRIDYHDGAGEFIYTAATVEKTYNHLFGDCIAFNWGIRSKANAIPL
jgi:hypothetical protein